MKIITQETKSKSNSHIALNNDYQKALLQKGSRLLWSLNYHKQSEKHCLAISNILQLY